MKGREICHFGRREGQKGQKMHYMAVKESKKCLVLVV